MPAGGSRSEREVFLCGDVREDECAHGQELWVAWKYVFSWFLKRFSH